MIVAANIAAAMTRSGTNAAELARAAGLNTSGVYDILTGRSRNPRLDTITKIAQALHVPVSDLFDERADRDIRREIMNAVSMLPEAEQRMILRTARAWLDEH